MKVIELLEGTWALPDTPSKVKVLFDLLKEPRSKVDVMNGKNVEDLIHSIVGDDEISDDLYFAAKNDDVRPIITKHLHRLLDTRSWKRKPDEDTQFLIDLMLKKYRNKGQQ